MGYVTIHKHQMDELLKDRLGFEEVETGASTQEYAYLFRHPKYEDFGIWIYSSIDKRSGESRKKGSDAIRVMLYHFPTKTRFWTLPKVLRVTNWRENLHKRCRLAAGCICEVEPVLCDKCGAPMRYVDNGSKRGFYGCARYPDCSNVMWLEKMNNRREMVMEKANSKLKG